MVPLVCFTAPLDGASAKAREEHQRREEVTEINLLVQLENTRPHQTCSVTARQELWLDFAAVD